MSTTVYVNSVTLTDATEFNRFDTAAYCYLTGAAGTNTVTATGPANMTLATPQHPVILVPAVTNTGATTLNITPSGGAALGAKNVFCNGIACVAGELKAGVPAILIYDGTQYQIVGPFVGGTVPGAVTLQSTLAVTGAVTLAGGASVTGANNFAIPTGRLFYLDGGGDSYLLESSANVIDIVAGGVTGARFTATSAALFGTLAVTGAATLQSTLAVTGVTTLSGGLVAKGSGGVAAANQLGISNSAGTISLNAYGPSAGNRGEYYFYGIDSAGANSLLLATFTSAGAIIFPVSASPASNGTGTAGTITWDASYIYVCTATNTWKRAALTGGY